MRESFRFDYRTSRVFLTIASRQFGKKFYWVDFQIGRVSSIMTNHLSEREFTSVDSISCLIQPRISISKIQQAAFKCCCHLDRVILTSVGFIFQLELFRFSFRLFPAFKGPSINIRWKALEFYFGSNSSYWPFTILKRENWDYWLIHRTSKCSKGIWAFFYFHQKFILFFQMLNLFNWWKQSHFTAENSFSSSLESILICQFIFRMFPPHTLNIRWLFKLVAQKVTPVSKTIDAISLKLFPLRLKERRFLGNSNTLFD